VLLKETKKMEDLTAVSSKIMVTPKKLRKIKHTPTTSTSVSASGTTTAADAAIDSTSRDGGSVAVVEESDTEAGIHSASDSIHDILNDRVVTDHNDQNDELINKTAGKFYDSINERILPSKSPSKIVNDHQHRIISSIADKWVYSNVQITHAYTTAAMPDYEFLNNIESDAKKRDALLTKLFSAIGCENKSAYVNYRIHNTPFINMGNVNIPKLVPSVRQ
jgi:hypothetical protein